MLRYDIEDGLIGAGQPTPEEFKALAEDGVKSIVDLRLVGESHRPENEQAIVESLGMKFVHMPIAGAPDVTVENAKALANLLATLPQPVVVHCGSSNRVGALFALKARYVDGRSPAEALAYGKKAGMHNLTEHVESLL